MFENIKFCGHKNVVDVFNFVNQSCGRLRHQVGVVCACVCVFVCARTFVFVCVVVIANDH